MADSLGVVEGVVDLVADRREGCGADVYQLDR